MKQVITARKMTLVLLCMFFAALIPWAAIARYTGSEGWVGHRSDATWRVNTLVAMYTGSEGWVDQLAGFVVVQQGIAKTRGEAGSFDPYVGQITLVRSLYDRGDWKGSYMAMNRLMDMLENREGDISAKAADAIWDFCYEVTPPALHDVKRHKQWWDKTVNWEKFFWEE